MVIIFKLIKRTISMNIPKMENSPKIVNQTLIGEWHEIQEMMRSKIVESDTESWQKDFTELKYVGGLDIYSDPNDNKGFAAFSICSFPNLIKVHEEVIQVNLEYPYVPGYLAFRESGPLIDLINKIKNEKPELLPQVLFVDGNGILHNQQCGLASQIGYKTNIPAIGIGKNYFAIKDVEFNKQDAQVKLVNFGDCIYIKNSDNKVIGLALKSSSKAKNPIYLSIGHKISLETSKKLTLLCSKFRIPEPIRFADNLSRETFRKYVNKL